MALELNGSTGVSLVQDGVITDANLPAGSVLQVVQTTKTDTFSTQSTSFVDITGMSASITPSSSSNKILLTLTMSISGFGHASMRLLRNSTNIAIGNASGNRTQATNHLSYTSTYATEYNQQVATMMWLDSPSTTSSVTYKVQGAVPYSNSYFLVVNRSKPDADFNYEGRTVSSITLMEIAA